MTSCLSAACVLGTLIVGILVMTRVITLEKVMDVVMRAFLVVICVFVALCILRTLFISVVIPWFSSLMAMLLWVAVISLAIIVLVLIVRAIFLKSQS